MSVSSVSSTSQSTYSIFSTTSLTEEQQEKLQKILSQYNSDSFSSSDRDSLLKQLTQAGIPIKDADLALPPTPAESSTDNDSEDSTATATSDTTTVSRSSLLEEYKAGKISAEELRAQLLEQLPSIYNASGTISSSAAAGALINIIA